MKNKLRHEKFFREIELERARERWHPACLLLYSDLFLRSTTKRNYLNNKTKKELVNEGEIYFKITCLEQ